MNLKNELIFTATYDDPYHEFSFEPEELVINGVSIMNVDKIQTRINHSGILELRFFRNGDLLAKDTVLDGSFELLKVHRDGFHLHYKIVKNSPGRP